MAYVLRAYIAKAYIVIAYVVVACIVMVCIVMASEAMHGPCTRRWLLKGQLGVTLSAGGIVPTAPDGHRP